MAAPSKRARMRQAAKALGLTLGGYSYVRRGGEQALAERSSSSLQKQAGREMDRAYAPVEASFSKREAAVRGLDEKHKNDEAAYQSWLTTKQTEIRQESETRAAATRALAEGHQADLKAQVDEIAAAHAKQNAEVGGEAASVAPTVTTTAQAAVTSSNTAFQGLVAKQNLGGDLLAATSANNLASLTAARSKRQADTLDKLAEVATGRDKAALQRASDENRRIAQLLDGEVQKAQVRIAGQQFSTKEANRAADAAAGRATTKRGQDSTARTQANAQAEAKRRWGETLNKFGFTNAQWKRFSGSRQASERKKYNAKKGGANGNKPYNKRQEATARSNIATHVGEAQGRIKPADYKGDWPPPRAYPPHGAGVLSNWLRQNLGWEKNTADIVAWTVVYKPKNTKYPRGIQERFDQYAASLPS